MTQPIGLKDVRDAIFQAGDDIAVAFRITDSTIRLGTVVEIISKPYDWYDYSDLDSNGRAIKKVREDFKIEVAWKTGSVKRSKIEYHQRRIVKV